MENCRPGPPKSFCGAAPNVACSNFLSLQRQTLLIEPHTSHSFHPPSPNHQFAMSRCQAVARPLARQLRLPVRSFTTGVARPAEVQDASASASASASSQPSPLDLDPNTVLPEFESQLMKAGKMPVGSRRRRVALRTSPTNIPFEHLPYQAFQEARKILAADRLEKLAKIQKELAKIAALQARDPADINGGQKMKDTRLSSLRRYVDELKILADINDPLVKKRFEDGLGMSTLHSAQLSLCFSSVPLKRRQLTIPFQAT